MVQLFGSMRIGEVLAIKWKDLDFINNIIYIDNAITQVIEFDMDFNVKNRKTVISDTKTAASVRQVPMPDILKKSLLRWHRERKQLEEKKGISFTSPEDLVFANDEGKLRTYSGTRSMFMRLMSSSGLDKYNIHFHSIRHTYSSMLFEAHENPKIIQQLLGHKDVTTTIRLTTVWIVRISYKRQINSNPDLMKNDITKRLRGNILQPFCLCFLLCY